MRAGIIRKVRFATPKSSVFANYIDYMDREEAIAKETKDFNLFAEYMDNDAKTKGLFNSTGYLTEAEKKSLKSQISNAQVAGSCLTQGLFSFDYDWIRENGIVDTETGFVREDTLMNYASEAIETMLKKEKFDNALWTASIHHNTEHIHIHFLLVDPDVSWEKGEGRCFMNSKGQLCQKGTISKKALDAGTSKLANSIMQTKELNMLMTDIMRNKIIGKFNDNSKELLSRNKLIKRSFMSLANNIPYNILKYSYGNTQMKPYREDINKFSNLLLNEFFPEELKEFTELTEDMYNKYKLAYGGEYAEKYLSDKTNELYQRLGNAVLHEIKAIQQNRNLKDKVSFQNMLNDNSAMININSALYNLRSAFGKDINSMKNQAAYMRDNYHARKGDL